MKMCGKCQEEMNRLKKELARYRRLSYKNDLTRLWNRRKLKQDVKRYKSLKARFGIKFLLLMIDLDKFKKVNDTQGHKEGDSLLKRVAGVLKQNIRAYENVYHLSGDEFVMIVSHYKNYATITKRIKRALGKIGVSASIGTCEIDKKRCLEIADEGMYKDKKRENNV